MENTNLAIPELNGVADSTAALLVDNFATYYKQANEFSKAAMTIVVRSAEDVEQMQQAKEARGQIRRIRLDAADKKNDLKAEALAYNKAIDLINKTIENKCKEAEKYLEEQEKFAEKQLEQGRLAEISEFSEFVVMNQKWGRMSEQDYNLILSNAKLLRDAKILREKEEAEAEKRIAERHKVEVARTRQLSSLGVFFDYVSDLSEQDFLALLERSKFDFEEKAKAAKEKMESARIAAENGNERLRKEAAEREKKEAAAKLARDKEDEARWKAASEAKAVREKLEGEAKAARENERAAKEQAAKLADEAAAKLAKEEAEKQKRLQAGDVEKLDIFIADLREIQVPDSFKSDKGEQAAAWITLQLDRLVLSINTLKERL